eukprot:scaffold3619_cov20-Tisochrysis_lutea.AAC.1
MLWRVATVPYSRSVFRKFATMQELHMVNAVWAKTPRSTSVVHDAVLVYDRRSVQPLEAPLCRIVIEIVHAYLPISLLLQNAKTAINFFPTVACRLLPMLPLAREANRAMAKFRET